MHEANPVATHKHRNGGTEDLVGSHVPYCETVGCHRYLMTGTCPDIAFAVLHATQAMDRPNEADWIDVKRTVKCRCNERQYNEMFRIAKLFLGPFPFPYLMCVKTFQFNEF